MNVEGEGGDGFSLSSDTLRLVLTDVGVTCCLNLHTIFAVLGDELHVFVFFFLYSDAVFKPLHCEDLVIELAVELGLRSGSH